MAHENELGRVVDQSNQVSIGVSARTDQKVVLRLRLNEHTMATEMSPELARQLARTLIAAAHAAETGRRLQ
jgi:hypothetical protein